MSIRVLLADDHHMFRELLQGPLAAEPDIDVVAGTSSGVETLVTVGRVLPDVLVLDIAFPDMNGIEVARQVAQRYPSVRVVALTGYADKVFVEQMLKAGALGYVVKSSGVAGLVSAIRAAATGHSFLSKEVASALLCRSDQGTEPIAPPVTILGRREQEVLRLLADGRRSSEIAAELLITTATVDVHRRNIKRKLGLNSTAELTRYASREGLASML